MAVFTEVPESELKAFLADYDLGDISLIEGIAEGTENTNYKISTNNGDYILTILEGRVKKQDAPIIASFYKHLETKNYICPNVIDSKSEQRMGKIGNKQAIIQTFIKGDKRLDPTPEDCHAAGMSLAGLHRMGKDYENSLPNHYSIDYVEKTLPEIDKAATSSEHENALNDMYATVAQLRDMVTSDLPQGIIHGDMFRDNVFFDGERVVGIIDLWFACTDTYIYDLAISLNDWCFDENGHIKPMHFAAMLEGYNSARPLKGFEIGNLPIELRRSALRFLTSRLYDEVYQKDAEVMAHNEKPWQPWHTRLKYHNRMESLRDYGSR